MPPRWLKSGTTGRTAGAREAERFELGAVVFGVAEREIGAFDVRRQFAAASKALLDEVPMHADEVLRRGDVVIDERHPSRKGERRSRRAGADREVVDQDVFRRDGADHLAVVDRAVLERGDRRFRRRSPIRTRRCAARAARRGPRGRWRRRSPAWRAPDGRAGGRSCGSCPAGRRDSGVDGAGREASRGRLPRAESPAGGVRTIRAAARCAGAGRPSIELPEHVQILLLDHRPGVVAREVLPAISSRAGREAARSIRASTAFRRTPRSSRNRARRCSGCTAP